MSDVERREARLPARFTTRVKGVTFCDGYPDNMGRLELRVRRHELYGGEPATIRAVLRRNPENEHDTNAIEVHVDEVGMIGHVERRTAEKLAPSLDAGDEWVTVVSEVLVREEDPSHPGITLTVTRQL